MEYLKKFKQYIKEAKELDEKSVTGGLDGGPRYSNTGSVGIATDSPYSVLTAYGENKSDTITQWKF